MAGIKVLDELTVNQIAAGEVIERPSSVAKELLENAIDSGARAVTIEIKEGGLSLIRVTDNGCGIEKNDVRMAFLPHATSKITDAQDLLSVASLGFRGEALASIASVARVELVTRTEEALGGSRYCIEGGNEKSFEEVGAPVGTTVIVRDLFFNTPARRKFLKSAASEGAHVAALTEKIALSHPEISFCLIQNGQTKFHSAGNRRLKDLIYTVFGRDMASNLLAVDTQQGGIGISGYIAGAGFARANRSFENYFVNARYIKNSLIQRAIEEAYKPYLMPHKYPFVMLHVTVDPKEIDVNVHPAKMEVRFCDGERLYEAVYQALRDTLSGNEMIPRIRLDDREAGEKREVEGKREEGRPEPFETVRRGSLYDREPSLPGLCREETVNASEEPPGEENKAALALDGKKDPFHKNEESAFAGISEESVQGEEKEKESGPVPDTPCVQEESPCQMTLFDGKFLDPSLKDEVRVIGQVFSTYWLAQFQDKLFIIDQHAAHEKVLYERTMRELKNAQVMTQFINPPVLVTLGRRQEELYQRFKEAFLQLGFEIEPFGGREYALRGVPAHLPSVAKEELFLELIDGLSDETGMREPEVIRDKVAMMSCKAAVKGKNTLSTAEAQALIEALMSLENPYNCPHGRPTIISMSRYELEKKFKRVL